MSDERKPLLDSGKQVWCRSHPPGVSMDPHYVTRTLCLANARVDCTKGCPNSIFKLVFRPQAGNQIVACPRWESEAARISGAPVQGYAMVRRETCFTLRPFSWCPSCPNSRSTEPSRTEPGWLDREKKNTRKRLPIAPTEGPDDD